TSPRSASSDRRTRASAWSRERWCRLRTRRRSSARCCANRCEPVATRDGHAEWRNEMLAFVFPGQGAQSRGMGRDLFDPIRELASIEREIDACLGYSMRQLCLEKPDNRLKETQYTQPSMYVVNALYYYQANGRGERPSFLAGHSFGEYNALLAAGA